MVMLRLAEKVGRWCSGCNKFKKYKIQFPMNVGLGLNIEWFCVDMAQGRRIWRKEREAEMKRQCSSKV